MHGTTGRIREQFEEVCRWAKTYDNTSWAIRSSTWEGRKILQALTALGKSVYEELDPSIAAFLSAQISKGQSNLPRVLWVALVPKGSRVSNQMSVVACFSPNGEGAVVGVMDSASFPRRLAPLVKRTDGELGVNVDGRSPNARYNDRFVNPKEFLVSEFDEQEFVDQMIDSAVTLVDLIGLRNSKRNK